MSNLSCVPDLRRNSISVSALSETGLDCYCRNETVKSDGEVVMKGTKIGNLYLLESKTVEVLTIKTIKQNSDKTTFWRRILGHIGVNGLNEHRK